MKHQQSWATSAGVILEKSAANTVALIQINAGINNEVATKDFLVDVARSEPANPELDAADSPGLMLISGNIFHVFDDFSYQPRIHAEITGNRLDVSFPGALGKTLTVDLQDPQRPEAASAGTTFEALLAAELARTILLLSQGRENEIPCNTELAEHLGFKVSTSEIVLASADYELDSLETDEVYAHAHEILIFNRLNRAEQLPQQELLLIKPCLVTPVAEDATSTMPLPTASNTDAFLSYGFPTAAPGERLPLNQFGLLTEQLCWQLISTSHNLANVVPNN